MLKRMLNSPPPVWERTAPPPPHEDVVAARQKSYTSAAIVTFVLYWLLWVPGFVANVLYYREAKEREQVAGRSLPGVGFLSILLWVNAIALAIIGLLLVALMV